MEKNAKPVYSNDKGIKHSKILHIIALFKHITVKELANELNHEAHFVALIVQELLDNDEIEVYHHVKNDLGLDVPAFQIKKVKP